MFQNINLSGKSREQLADALVNTELEYVRALETVDNVRNRLQQLLALDRPVLSVAEIDRIFQNLTSIADFHKDLSKTLLTLRLEGPQEFLRKLGETFCRFIPFFKLYANYIGNYRTASQYITKKLHQSKSFRAFVELEERCAGTNKSFKNLLGLPMGRLPQYLHILFAIHSRPGSVGTHLEKAILAIQAVSDAISADIKSQAARKLVITVQDKVFGKSLNLIAPSRYMVKKGELRVTMPSPHTRRFALTRRTQPKMYLVVLFNDLVLVGSARKRPGRNRKVKVLMRIAGLECEDPEDGTHSFVLRTNLGDVETAMIMYAQNAEQKLAWLSAIDRVLEEYIHSAHEEYLESISEFEACVLKKQHKKNHQIEPKIRNPVPIDQTVIHMRPLLDVEFSDPTANGELEPVPEEQFADPWQRVEGYYYINTRTLERVWSLDEKTVPLDQAPSHPDALSPRSFEPVSSPCEAPIALATAASSSCEMSSVSRSHSFSALLGEAEASALQPPPAPTPIHASPKTMLSSPHLLRGASLRRQPTSTPEFGPVITDLGPTPPGSPPRAPDPPPSSPPRQFLRSVNVIPPSEVGPPALSLRAASVADSDGGLLAALQQKATTLKKVTSGASQENTTFHNAINDSIASYIQSIRPLIQEDDDVSDSEEWK